MTKDVTDILKAMKAGKGKISPATKSRLIDRINAITKDRNRDKPHWLDLATATGETQQVETVRVPKPEHRPSAKTMKKFKGKLGGR